jgi:hypothetical protein
MTVLVDLIQTSLIVFWLIMMTLLSRRVSRLNKRLDETRAAVRTPVFQIQDPKPVCGCGHHQCFHDENSCAKVEYHTWDRRDSYERALVPCGCKRYTGPEQLPTVIP